MRIASDRSSNKARLCSWPSCCTGVASKLRLSASSCELLKTRRVRCCSCGVQSTAIELVLSTTAAGCTSRLTVSQNV